MTAVLLCIAPITTNSIKEVTYLHIANTSMAQNTKYSALHIPVVTFAHVNIKCRL